MVQRYKLIGAFALVLCLAAVSFGIVAEDSEQADADITTFSGALNGYAKYLLGDNQAVFESGDDGQKLTITIDTGEIVSDKVTLNLLDPYDEFMNRIKAVGVHDLTIKHVEDSKEVSFVLIKDESLDHSAALFFMLSVFNEYKNSKTATYEGTIVINNDSFDLEVSIVFTDASYGVLSTLLGKGIISVDMKNQKVSLNMIEEIAKILNSSDEKQYVTFKEFRGMTILGIMELLKGDEAIAIIANMVGGTQHPEYMAYLNSVCGKIVDAANLPNFFKDVFSLTIKDTNFSFGTATISEKKDLQGLFETIYSAMDAGTNFEKKAISELDSSQTAGTVSLMVTVHWNGGQAQGTIIDNKQVDIVFGAPASVTPAQVSGGTITITPANDDLVCWDEITITCVPSSSSYTLTSVGYKIAGGKVIPLTNDDEQTFQIPYEANGKAVEITAKFTGSGPGPGPTPPTSKYTVRFTPTEGGTVQPTVVIVDSGATITAEANVLKVGSNTVTATPDKGYVFKSWSVTTGTVTSNMTIAVTFEKGEPTEPILVVDDEGSVYIPADVVQTLGIKDPEKLELTITSVQPTTPNVPENAVCYSVTLVYDGKALKQFSDYIDVALSFTPPYGADISKFKVYFVSDDGRTVEDMHATYDSFSHAMVFKIPHLSTFAITDQVIEPIPAVLQSISVKTAPAKVSYTTGDCFDPTGLVISLKYDDGSSLDLAYKGNESQFTFEPSTTTALKTTDKSVTITHEGKTTTQAITVSDPAPSSGGDNTVLIIVIVIIVILVIAAGVFFYMKKKAA